MVKRTAQAIVWSPGFAVVCDACNQTRHSSVRLATEPSFRGVINLCQACARHVAKAAAQFTPAATGRRTEEKKT